MSGIDAYLRRRAITDHVRRHRGVRVGELLAELGCSYSTLHRDLDQMARAGLIRRVHGGIAVRSAGAAIDPPSRRLETWR